MFTQGSPALQMDLENVSYPDDFWKGLGLIKSNMKQ
jgi:hypothetical protein